MQVIVPDELPRFLPGEPLLAADGSGGGDVTVRSYRYRAAQVDIPPLRDFAIAAYTRGATLMSRRVGRAWRREDVAPGCVSLLTRAEESHWSFGDDIDVVQVYLSSRFVERIGAEVFERSVAGVALRDVLKADDPVLYGAVLALARESATPAPGGRLYIEAVATQLAVHLLRTYAMVAFPTTEGVTPLSAAKARKIVEHVDAHLAEPIALADLARIAVASSWHFSRQFKARFGLPPHAWLLERRVTRAKRLLDEGAMPIKTIAAEVGFADHAHLTRTFRRIVGTTPEGYRRARRG